MTNSQKAAIEEAADKYERRYDGISAMDYTAGLQEVIEHPERYELISYEDANQLFDKRADESAMVFRKIRDELEAENQRLREALERISSDDYLSKALPRLIAKEALKQQDNG